jgi:hypothetical protein
VEGLDQKVMGIGGRYIVEGLHQQVMGICRRRVYSGGSTPEGNCYRRKVYSVALSLECVEYRGVHVAGIDEGREPWISDGGGLRSGHLKGEIPVYGPYHLVSCLAVKIQCLYRWVGGDSAYEERLNIRACIDG